MIAIALLSIGGSVIGYIIGFGSGFRAGAAAQRKMDADAVGLTEQPE